MDKSKEEKTIEEWTHPEIREGEIFCTNVSEKIFKIMPFETKRRGIVAFDGKGNKISRNDWRPVFLQEEEMFDLGLTLQDIRNTWRG